jgi:hypothetical protein
MGLAGLVHSIAQRPSKSKSRIALVAGCALAKLVRSNDWMQQRKIVRMMTAQQFQSARGHSWKPEHHGSLGAGWLPDARVDFA